MGPIDVDTVASSAAAAASGTRAVSAPPLTTARVEVMVDRLHRSLAAAAEEVLAAAGNEDSAVARWQAHSNGVVSRHHGGVAFLRRWGIVAGGCATEPGPLRLSKLTRDARSALRRVLHPDAHFWVLSLQATSTLDAWTAQVERMKAKLFSLNLPGMANAKSTGQRSRNLLKTQLATNSRKHQQCKRATRHNTTKQHTRTQRLQTLCASLCRDARVERCASSRATFNTRNPTQRRAQRSQRDAPRQTTPQQTQQKTNRREPGYHVVWLLRSLVAGACHVAGVPVRVAPTDDVQMLKAGFPDMTDQVAWAAAATGARTVAGLVHCLHYRRGIQFLCMDLCLAKPARRWLVAHGLGAAWLDTIGHGMMARAGELESSLGVSPRLTAVLESLFQRPPQPNPQADSALKRPLLADSALKRPLRPSSMATKAELGAAAAAEVAAKADPVGAAGVAKVKAEAAQDDLAVVPDGAAQEQRAVWTQVGLTILCNKIPHGRTSKFFVWQHVWSVCSAILD